MSPSSTNPVDAYAHQVVNGEIPGGKYHRLACARHLRDRAREGQPDFPYRFVWEERDARGRLTPCAVRFLTFARQMKHYKGKQWAGQYFEPSDCQVFRLGSIFGWRRVETGGRRFTTAYDELPRKQGKSFEAGIVAVYVTFFEGEQGAEGVIIATKREQANIVFRVARLLVVKSRPGRRSLSRIVVSKHHLYVEATESKLEPLGADYDSTDGLNPSLIVIDEMHAMKNRGLIDVVETATGARADPLNFQITTAGNDPMSPCGDQHDYACKILDQVLTDEATETFFCFIAHADPEDDVWSEATWRKANPHYGGSVDPTDIRKLALKAKNMPAAAASFQQKRLNLWVNASAPWLSLEGWRRGQSRWMPEELRGEPCWLGVDMSSKIDLTAVVAAFPPREGRRRWRLVAWTLTPADTLEERAHRDRAPYLLWKADGVLRTNPGNRIDQDEVRALVNWAGDLFDVRQVGIDPWNAGNLVKDLTDDGYEVIEIPQTMQQMSGPSKDFEADVLDGLVDGGDNPLLAWCISNAVVQRDGKDNIYPVKKRSRGRIDPVIAALMARKLAAADLHEPPAEDPVLMFVGV